MVVLDVPIPGRNIIQVDHDTSIYPGNRGNMLKSQVHTRKIMDLSNRKDMRARFDFEFPRPMTLESWQDLLKMIEEETFYIGGDQEYEIKNIHGEVLIYTTPLDNKIEVTVYTIVDLGERIQ